MSAQQAGSACRQSRLDEAWLAKRAGETASTSVGASRSEPIYPAYYNKHITEAQKNEFKEYAAAKVEMSQARKSLASSTRSLLRAHRPSRASSSRDRDRAQSQFDEAAEKFKLASTDLTDRKRIIDCIRHIINRKRKRTKSDPYMNESA